MLPSIEESLSKFNDFDFYILTFDHSKKIVEKMINGLKIEILTDFKKKAVSYERIFYCDCCFWKCFIRIM